MRNNGSPVLNRVCYDCGKRMIGRKENYPYRECGLSRVVLLNVLVFHCECGAIVPEIPAPSVLHMAIAKSVLRKTTLLSAEEIRFLRKHAGYSATELSRVIGVLNTTISHWENDSKPIGKESDRLVRFAWFAKRIAVQIGEDDALSDPGCVATLARDIDMEKILKSLVDESSESESIKINPDTLVAGSPDVDSSEAARLVLQ